MYVTFPSSESKIFTLRQGHLAATPLSQAGSGCDAVNRGARGRRGLARASKINDAAGWQPLPGVVGTGDAGAGRVLSWRDEDRLAGEPVAAWLGRELWESGPGWRWWSGASAGGEGRQVCRARTDTSSVPTSHPSHQSRRCPSTAGTWGYGHTNHTSLPAFKELLEILLLFCRSILGTVKPSWKWLG